jgi:ribosomal protein L7Ae-like RNA K-turn-binding protein
VQCLKQARAGFSKAFKAPISSSPAELAVLLGSAAERRAAALLSAAQRSRKLVVGKTAVEKELSSGACRLLVIATDAKSAAGSREVAQVIASGGAVSWGTKTGLGGLVGRMEAGVLAVMDDGLANALKKTIAMAQSASLASSGTGSGAGQGLHRVIEQEARVEKECSTEVG